MLSSTTQQNETPPIAALPPLWERKQRAAMTLQSPRVVAARLGKTDRDTLALLVKNEHPVDGCTLRVGPKNQSASQRDSIMKRLGKSRRTAQKSVALLEALGLVGYRERERDNGSDTTTARYLNQQLLLDIGAGDLVWDEALRPSDVVFAELPEVSDILAVKRSLGPKNGRRKQGGEGVTFSSPLPESDAPGDAPVTPLRTTEVVPEPLRGEGEEVVERHPGVTSSVTPRGVPTEIPIAQDGEERDARSQSLARVEDLPVKGRLYRIEDDLGGPKRLAPRTFGETSPELFPPDERWLADLDAPLTRERAS